MTPQEKLREMMRNYAPDEENSAAGEHLRDEDFMRLIENASIPENPTNGNGKSAAFSATALLRNHLANCNSCLDKFEDFYAFHTPAGKDEPVAATREIDAAWQEFAPRIAGKNAEEKEVQKSFWARFFPAERKTNYFAALGWGFAALLLLSSIISIFVAQKASSEKAQLSGEIENQKQSFEERLKTLEQTTQNKDLAEQEKTRLTEEKDDLQKRIAALQAEIERAKQEKTAREKIASPAVNPPVADNSLVAINTPIYDVFPSDSAVRGGSEQSKNNLTVPNAAKSIVLILNAAGRADFNTYQAELVNNSGKIVWRGAGFKKDNLGNFTLTLARPALKPGNYRLRISGKNGGESFQPFAEYALTIGIK